VKRRLIRIVVVAFALFIALNVVAYRHAWRMTHFVPTGTRTQSPEKLSVFGKLVTLVRGVKVPKPELSEVRAEFPQPARTVSFVTQDGMKLEAWDIPASDEKGVAVMFHGYAVSRSALLGEARVLHELGWRTVLVDFRGSGGSDGLVTTLGWREAMDVTAAVDWARHEWPEAHVLLYGQSMGAVAVLRAIATEGVKADGIVLACPFDTLVHTVAHRYHAMGLPWFPFTQLLVLWGGVQHGFNGFAHNPAVYARAVRCPALVLDGERDPWVRPDEVQRVAAAIRGPTQCHIFVGGGHEGYWRDVPDEYRKTLGEWLTALPQSKNR
jgi:dipeptidyl aminopeptidase/acylaminoacyl peptidase